MELPIENVKKIEVVNGRVTIQYRDGIKMSTSDDVTLVRGYKNTNEIPLNDHCI